MWGGKQSSGFNNANGKLHICLVEWKISEKTIEQKGSQKYFLKERKAHWNLLTISICMHFFHPAVWLMPALLQKISTFPPKCFSQPSYSAVRSSSLVTSHLQTDRHNIVEVLTSFLPYKVNILCPKILCKLSLCLPPSLLSNIRNANPGPSFQQPPGKSLSKSLS